jgi:katanin p60 ATPase-containing subunit A1
VDSSILTSKWRGESEKLVSCLFSMARYYSPSIIFLDEIDALFLQRGSNSEHEASRAFKSVMFSQIDGLYNTVNNVVSNNLNKNIIIIGTTNHPWSLDIAIRRRLERRIYIPLPDFASRKQQFQLHTKSIKLSADIDFNELARLTAGYSGADLKSLCREAALLPVRSVINKLAPAEIRALNGSSALEFEVCQKEFLQAIEKIPPSVSQAETEKYILWQKEFGT